jgi:hypothetical protein
MYIMSDTAKQLFEGLKDAISELAPGLKDFGPRVGAEVSRLSTQGAMELASALFNGHGFVPYGPGQYTPTTEHEQPTPEVTHEMGMER